MKKIIINKLDYLRNKQPMETAKKLNRISGSQSKLLFNEPESAEIIDLEKILSNVVSTNSFVKTTFLEQLATAHLSERLSTALIG